MTSNRSRRHVTLSRVTCVVVAANVVVVLIFTIAAAIEERKVKSVISRMYRSFFLPSYNYYAFHHNLSFVSSITHPETAQSTIYKTKSNMEGSTKDQAIRLASALPIGPGPDKEAPGAKKQLLALMHLGPSVRNERASDYYDRNGCLRGRHSWLQQGISDQELEEIGLLRENLPRKSSQRRSELARRGSEACTRTFESAVGLDSGSVASGNGVGSGLRAGNGRAQGTIPPSTPRRARPVPRNPTPRRNPPRTHEAEMTHGAIEQNESSNQEVKIEACNVERVEDTGLYPVDNNGEITMEVGREPLPYGYIIREEMRRIQNEPEIEEESEMQQDAE